MVFSTADLAALEEGKGATNSAEVVWCEGKDAVFARASGVAF